MADQSNKDLMNTQMPANDPKSVQELTNFVQVTLQQMQDKFQSMSDQIINRIDEIDTRLNDLEKNLDTTFKGASGVAATGETQSSNDSNTITNQS